MKKRNLLRKIKNIVHEGNQPNNRKLEGTDGLRSDMSLLDLTETYRYEKC